MCGIRWWISSGAGRRRPRSALGRFIHWLGVTASKFYDWRQRYGRVNEHNGWVPRDFWLEPWEKEAIIGFHLKNPLEGYRRLTFMMLDARCGSRESGERMASVETSGTAVALERQVVTQGDRLRTAARSRTSTGMSMFPISTCRARSITYAACWMDAVVFWCIGICGSR